MYGEVKMEKMDRVRLLGVVYFGAIILFIILTFTSESIDAVSVIINILLFVVVFLIFFNARKAMKMIVAITGDLRNVTERITIGCQYTTKKWQEGFEKDLKKAVKIQADRKILNEIIGKWFSYYYAKLISEELFKPVNTDEKYMYSPFQCLASYFQRLGFKGIIYSSVAYPKASNIVLFDKAMAEPYGSIEIFYV